MTMTWPNQGAAANGLFAVRSSVAGIRERTVRSTAAAEAVAELGRYVPLMRSLVALIALALPGYSAAAAKVCAPAKMLQH